MMNLQSQATCSSSPVDLPLKRKRGRPCKDENPVKGENLPTAMPGSDSVRKNKMIGGTTSAPSGKMLGQMVSGVIEGSFDAGYLVKVKVGDTGTQLRGLVFLPGRFTPITAANDVAPQAKMYRRTEIPIPVPNSSMQPPCSVPSSEQHNKQPSELKSFTSTCQDQGLPSELPSNASTAHEKQFSSSILPVTDNLPMTGSGTILVGKVMPQPSVESGCQNQSIGEHDELLKEFEASMQKCPVVSAEATEQSVPQLTPSVAVLPGAETVNLELQIQRQAVSNDLKSNQLLDGGEKEPNQTSVSAEPEMMSSKPTGIDVWMGKQALLRKAISPLELNMNINTANDMSPLNGKPSGLASLTESANTLSEPMINLPATLFEREVILSAPKLTVNESKLQSMIEPQSYSSGTTNANITKKAAGSASLTSSPATLFEREAIPSEPPKLAINGPVLSTLPEPQFCVPPGPASNVECNMKDAAVPPAES